MYQIIICDKDNIFREKFYRQLEKVIKKLCIECCVIQCEKAEQVKTCLGKRTSGCTFCGNRIRKEFRF